MKTLKLNVGITSFVFLILLFMSVGYSALSQELEIIGNTKLEIPEYKIYISDVKVLSSESAVISSPTFSDNEVALYSDFLNTSGFVTYEITIRNVGESAAVVDYIHIMNNNSNVQYKISGINSTDVIPRITNVKVLVVVEPSMKSNDGDNLKSSISLDFSFLKYTDSYSNDCTLAWDGTTSSKPLSLNILGTDYYQISNANEFKWFMDQVNGGNTSINAMLNNNICLNDKSFTPIGSDSAYSGIFDGQNRSITGISFSRDVEIKSSNQTYSVGFFMNNSGTIKNVNITADYYDKQYVSTRESTLYLGGVVVNNAGVIENVSFNGKIELDAEAHVNCTARQAHTTNYIGGIVVANAGVIRGSYNNATFSLKGHTTSTTCNIYTRSSKIYAGGIAATNIGYISDTYNKANMTIDVYNQNSTRTTNISEIGGVVSNNIFMENNGTTLTGNIKNAYNIGTIDWNRSGTGSFDYFLDTVAVNTGNLNNIYLLSGTAENPNDTYNSTVVSASDLMQLNLSLGNGFKKDLKNKNGGYPILYWQ